MMPANPSLHLAQNAGAFASSEFFVRSHKQEDFIMKAEFTAIIEPAPEGGFWAICPEVPGGANGQ